MDETAGTDATTGTTADAGTTTNAGTTTGLGSATAGETGSEGCICADVYAPVCGKDGNTYDNACSAACAGVEVRREGECVGDCSGGNCLVGGDAPGTTAALWLAAAWWLLRRRRRQVGTITNASSTRPPY